MMNGGKGFTEWTNVTKASPRFKGHYQPHFPGGFGFSTAMSKNSFSKKIGKKSSVFFGFCYYHYWFNGQRNTNLWIEKCETQRD
jgi:lipopolysaccharide biosynthesis protein